MADWEWISTKREEDVCFKEWEFRVGDYLAIS